MRARILSVLITFAFLGCATNTPNSKNISLLNFEIEQSANSLPQNEADLKFSGDELLKKRLEVFEKTGQRYADENAKWAFEVYKPSEKKRYFFSNFRQIPKEWFSRQLENANFSALNSLAVPAVTTANTALRNFPTDEIVFREPKAAGEGYPFDQLQASSLNISQPLFISHFSKDKAWAFVRDDATWGWVKAQDIKILNQTQANAFKGRKFLVVTAEKTPVYDEAGEFIFYARAGAFLDYLREDAQKFYGEIWTRSGLKSYQISKDVAGHFPLKFDDKNVRRLANGLLHQPYGWGGLGELRDCSLFTRDFLGSFGFWLPRNSRAQSEHGEKIALDGLTNKQKLLIIKERGVPYRTLIHLPGHIMIYVGQRDGKVFVLHDAWGLKTRNDGRAIIGAVALTTLDIGSEQIDEKNLLISRINSINILKTPKILDDNLSENLAHGKPLVSSLGGFKKFALGQNLKNDAILDINASKKLRFERAYGVRIEQNLVKFKDGGEIKFDSGVLNDDECSRGDADVKDMIAFDYPALAPLNSALTDAGRCRNYELLGKIYGSSENEVRKNLVDVIWLEKSLNLKLKFNSQNGAANALMSVSKELDELAMREPGMLEFLKNPGGTFKWRVIAGTNRLSAHSYGIAIDVNVAKSHYWRWSKNGYENLIPYKIVEIFERHKFVWGGRWRHFDTMHFEYRPELFE